MKIWLADLTYTQQTIASDIIPAAVGLIAEYALATIQEVKECRLFKYPEDLSAAFANDRPDVIGFSNYVWNSALSIEYAREIKQDYPDIVTVMGGPNYPDSPLEQEAFLRLHPEIDFYVLREAEHGFAELLRALLLTGYSKVGLPRELPNLSYIDHSGFCVIASRSERLLQLEDVPSPYLSGRLDEFFDGRLLPVIQTARGCPFTCTFCTEGLSYWNKVRHKKAETVRDEIHYIAERLARLPESKRRTDLLIADSNFGMFAQDIDTCRVIAQTQDQYGYPKYMNVATGKNKKERVLEAARLVRGAMKFAGSVQSLDPVVQENIKRSNISTDQIMELAMRSAEVGANSYSEVILALPGDSLQSHFNTLKLLVEAGFQTLSMYTLMVLMGTELGSEESRSIHEMDIRYRVLPRCFGEYEFNGRKMRVAEIEEVCVANKTLPFSDYLQCRKMNLIVNVFYNDGVFSELMKIFRLCGMSSWDWIEAIYESESKGDFQELLDAFADETANELWRDKDELAATLETPGQIGRYLDGELGSNLIFKYKALSLTRYFPAVCNLALLSARNCIQRLAIDDADKILVAIEDVIIYKRLQIEGVFDGVAERKGVLRYDVAGFLKLKKKGDLDALRLSMPQEILFSHSDEQRRSIESYVGIFGNDTRGLSRILSRVFLKQLFRAPVSTRV
jgi:radical SAM superfamily enzyme YgiQ (UPF0313 family)